MPYTKTNWQSGDIISSERLNHAEEGIAQAQQTADAVNARDSLADLTDVKITGTPSTGSLLRFGYTPDGDIHEKCDIDLNIQNKIEDVISNTNLQYDSLKQIRRLWFILSHVPKEEIYRCHTISQRDDLFSRVLYKSEFFDSNTSFLHEKFILDDYWNTFMLYDIFYYIFNGIIPEWN